MVTAAVNNDAELVNGTLAGNRDAFAQIVARYQSLICSLTYSATGNLGQSEDLAQETFITAWKHLRQLRERDKLRAWLCGIARNRVNNFLRREGREPIRKAEPLEEISESHSPEPLPADYVISKEESEILWRSLERIPEIYREPLILFYREHQSIETVAANLDLTEDNVKQRLSRGRKMLQEQVLAFVEGALARTNPGQTFTSNVLAALPALTFSTKAATLGVAAKGASVKTVGAMGMFSAILSPLLVIFGNYASYKMSMDEAHTDEERGRIKSAFVNSLYITLVLSIVIGMPLYIVLRNHKDGWWFFEYFFSQMVVIYFVTILAFVFATLPARRRHLAQTLANECGGEFPPAAYEFRSRASLLGLPLVHVRIGDRFDVLRGPVKAWIAIGSSHAVGVIFASGGLAVAPISFGGVAIGLLPFGAIAMGLIPIGALAVGGWAYGGLAAGWQAFGGCAIAWNAATGGMAFALDIARGGIANAVQVNNQFADNFFGQNIFFRCAEAVSDHGFLVMLAWIIPVVVQARIVGNARRRRELGN
jgi:RNA polymerase sigma factor (sigma-70 family)